MNYPSDILTSSRSIWNSCFVHSQTEISLQPWNAFKPDGIILFSDILTPLAGMNVPFDIEAGVGPVIHSPIRNMEVMPNRLV